MFATIGRWTLSSQFYVYGRSNFTKTGWETAKKGYSLPDLLESELDLSDKVFMITGANAGIGKEMTKYLVSKKATVYMVCRNAARAEVARTEIVEATQNTKVFVLIADCCLQGDIHRVWREFEDHQKLTEHFQTLRLDGLICNAGALPHERTLTTEGVETIIAAHLLFGTYLLGKLALPLLSQTEGSRLVVVSSGGMYNSKFPYWEDAVTMTPANEGAGFNGQMTYCVAKRGQVLLCEQWAELYKGKVKIVSCHPGWTLTEGLDTTYGENKKYLEPLRSLWEGSEGILWLLVAPLSEVVDGAYYLDRSPQRKHLSGLLYGESSITANTAEEVRDMMEHLELWSINLSEGLRQSAAVVARAQPLVPISRTVSLPDFMGQWYVLANIPTIIEAGLSNCTEFYRWNDVEKRVKVSFQYYSNTQAVSTSTAPSEIKQIGNLINPPVNSHWGICPKVLGVYVPINHGFLIVDLAEDYSYALVGVPDRAYLWVLTRSVPSDFAAANVSVIAAYGLTDSSGSGGVGMVQSTNEEQRAKVVYEKELLQRVVSKSTELGYDSSKILRVPWISK